MKTAIELTAILSREGDGSVALCREPDIASQGTTVAEVRRNLGEAVELFCKTADASEVWSRW